ncbi:hypothetical protein EDB86DRAFT_2835047 [Lactarius hatsudake]|nr:hypothetical protein EDB86DRAFT_2835047 [Lactarius hatsudake]
MPATSPASQALPSPPSALPHLCRRAHEGTPPPLPLSPVHSTPFMWKAGAQGYFSPQPPLPTWPHHPVHVERGHAKACDSLPSPFMWKGGAWGHSAPPLHISPTPSLLSMCCPIRADRGHAKADCPTSLCRPLPQPFPLVCAAPYVWKGACKASHPLPSPFARSGAARGHTTLPLPPSSLLPSSCHPVRAERGHARERDHLAPLPHLHGRGCARRPANPYVRGTQGHNPQLHLSSFMGKV